MLFVKFDVRTAMAWVIRVMQFAIKWDVVALDASSPLRTRMEIEQLTGEALG